jgi:hypothetical protein
VVITNIPNQSGDGSFDIDVTAPDPGVIPSAPPRYIGGGNVTPAPEPVYLPPPQRIDPGNPTPTAGTDSSDTALFNAGVNAVKAVGREPNYTEIARGVEDYDNVMRTLQSPIDAVQKYFDKYKLPPEYLAEQLPKTNMPTWLYDPRGAPFVIMVANSEST